MNITMRVVQRRNDFQNLKYSWKASFTNNDFQAAKNVIQRMQDSFEEPKSGRVYNKRGSPHVASAPGEAPAIWDGELYDSFYIRRLNQYAVGIGSHDPKAELLEYGGAAIAPRPYVRPALAAEQREYVNTILRIMGRP